MRLVLLTLALGTALITIVPGPILASKAYTSNFRIEDCTWSAKTDQNPFFILRPGYRLVFSGEEDGAELALEITVTKRKEWVSFDSAKGIPMNVKTRVVEEREWEDEELIEVSRNWFALCKETGDVYYFGEEVDLYEDGEIVGTEGAWRAGEEGALPGIIMPGTFLLGARYFQEMAPGVAMDRAKHVDMELTLDLPAGTFTDCVSVQETTPLDPGEKDFKFYCPGIGLAIDADLELTRVEVVSGGEED